MKLVVVLLVVSLSHVGYAMFLQGRHTRYVYDFKIFLAVIMKLIGSALKVIIY